jgi:hypothetical protein
MYVLLTFKNCRRAVPHLLIYFLFLYVYHVFVTLSHIDT